MMFWSINSSQAAVYWIEVRVEGYYWGPGGDHPNTVMKVYPCADQNASPYSSLSFPILDDYSGYHTLNPKIVLFFYSACRNFRVKFVDLDDTSFHMSSWPGSAYDSTSIRTSWWVTNGPYQLSYSSFVISTISGVSGYF